MHLNLQKTKCVNVLLLDSLKNKERGQVISRPKFIHLGDYLYLAPTEVLELYGHELPIRAKVAF